MPRKSTIDPRWDPAGDTPVLAYLGTDWIPDVPTRDLTGGDIARLTYRRSLSATAAEGIDHDPAAPDPEAAAAIVAELVGSGLYSTKIPAPSPEPVPVTPAEPEG